MHRRPPTGPALTAVTGLLTLLLLSGTVAFAGPAGATATTSRRLTAAAPARVASGSRIPVSGSVPTEPSRGRRTARLVRLQERVGRRWVGRATARSTRSGRFRFVLRAGTKGGTRAFRVVAIRTQRLGAARTGAIRVEVAAAPAAGAADYAVERDTDGTVVRWGACNAIPYYLNPAGAPAGWQAVVARVVARVSAATGYGFTYAGTTTAQPRALENAIVIAWSDASHTPELSGPTAGLGGTTWSGGLIVSGGVWMDRTLLTWGGPGRATLRAKLIEEILLHEMGHVMGLEHVTDRHQVMYPTSYGDLLGYQADDLSGLRAVGRSAGPCRTLPPPQAWPAGEQRTAARRRTLG
jgi:hypothetical protein